MNDHVTDVRGGSRGMMTFDKSASFVYIQLQGLFLSILFWQIVKQPLYQQLKNGTIIYIIYFNKFVH